MRPSRRCSVPLLLAALVAAGCGDTEPVVEAEPRPVRAQVVAPFSESIPSVLAGVARSGLESNLSFRVAGTVVELPATVGRQVRRGEVLGRLDPIDYELAVEEARAALAQAEAGLRRAIADYGRARALYENNNAAKSELDANRAAFESAGAQVEAAQKRLEQAQQRAGYTVLRAPADGAVAAVDVERNETVSAGQTVVRLTAGDRLEVEVGVTDATIGHLAVGMPAAVRFNSIPDARFAGTVSEVGVATARGSSTYPVTVRLDEASPRIRSGMAAEVAFAIDQHAGEGQFLVPAVAVGEDRDGRFVYLVDARGDGTATVTRRSVEVGRFTPRGVEILAGLAAGDVVVTAGVRRLAEGMPVRYDGGGAS